MRGAVVVGGADRNAVELTRRSGETGLSNYLTTWTWHQPQGSKTKISWRPFEADQRINGQHAGNK